jgi:cold-inducible RNA-binding protein
MSAKVYVGNLSSETTEETLSKVFSELGHVIDAIIMRDRDTGTSRGFGFVTFGSSEEAETVVDAMNGQDLDGNLLRVNLANARPAGS